MSNCLGEGWDLAGAFSKSYCVHLQEFVRREYVTATVYPPMEDVFNALLYTPFDKVKVVLLGQDPYHGPGQAHGLSFSVRPGVKVPPSLANMFKELHDDLGCFVPNNGYLKSWADQGVLLLNTVLTVRKGEASSHKGKGWEQLTDHIIGILNEKENPVVFLLWGRPALQKLPLIDQDKHFIIQSPHPSPLSAYRGFFGSKPFSKTNQFLKQTGQTEIDWQIPNL